MCTNLTKKPSESEPVSQLQSVSRSLTMVDVIEQQSGSMRASARVHVRSVSQ